ncbi:hypothetical protein KK062_30605, partial [Fulvivirgaceae bacterium PWU5]
INIEKQPSFLFVFPSDLVDQYDDVSVPKGRRSVRDVLQFVMNGSRLGYLQSGETVSIFESRKKPIKDNADEETKIENTFIT